VVSRERHASRPVPLKDRPQLRQQLVEASGVQRRVLEPSQKTGNVVIRVG